MRLDFLANAFRAAGLTVVEEPDWQTRGADWNPKGVMWHHTAPPVPYPVGNLYLTKSPSGVYRIKCNWNTKPTGVIHVIASGACNYSSGSGSGVVLAETMADVAPTGTARARGLPDTMGGNRHYINDEMDHRGDGGPVPVAQYHASMLAKAVVCEELGFSQRKVIGHAEFTRRKIDPRANGKLAHAFMEQGRSDIEMALGGSIPPIPPTGGKKLYEEITYQQGYGTGGGDPAVARWQRVFMDLDIDLSPHNDDGKAGDDFKGAVDTLTGRPTWSPAPGEVILNEIDGGKILAHYGGDPTGYMQLGVPYRGASTGSVVFTETEQA